MFTENSVLELFQLTLDISLTMVHNNSHSPWGPMIVISVSRDTERRSC